MKIVAKLTSVLSLGWVCARNDGRPIWRSALRTRPGVTWGTGVCAGGGPWGPAHWVPNGSQSPDSLRPHSLQSLSAGLGQVFAWPQSADRPTASVGPEPAQTDTHLYSTYVGALPLLSAGT